MDCKIVVLGAGPGGYQAAIRAAQLGASVTVVEQDELGGTCLNRGCIPTKSMLCSASLVKSVKKAADFGVNIENYSIDYPKISARKDAVVKQLRQGIEYLFKKNRINLVKGTGVLKSPRQISVNTPEGASRIIEAENIILATGSKPALIKGLGYNGTTVVTTNEVLTWKEIPADLIIVGGGVIGCEFATLFATLGCKVTIVETMPSILPMFDQQLAQRLSAVLKKAGVEIKTSSQVVAVEQENNRVKVTLGGGGVVTADKMLLAVGRQPNTGDLGLEEAGVRLGPKGEILIDENMRTSAPGIYAIGDATNKIQLAHAASAQGLAAVHTIMGRPATVNYDAIPSCIYTLPEMAGVGLSQEKAEEQGKQVTVGKFPFLASGKALLSGETDGLVKIIAENGSGRVLGVFIMGPHATELIGEGVLAVSRGVTASELADAIHAHPTLSEAIVEAAEDVQGHSIHQ